MPTATSKDLDKAAAAAEAQLTGEQSSDIDKAVTSATSQAAASAAPATSKDEAYPWPMGKKLNIIAHNISGQNLFLTHQSADGTQYTLFHGAKKNGKGNCGIMFLANSDQNALLPIPDSFE
jgi:hypothetical protein